MFNDQPDWIRDLYRDIYPQAPIYPVGPRNTGTRVSGWQATTRPNVPRVPMFSQPDPNINQPIPDNLMAGNQTLPVTSPISSGQISDDATSLLGRSELSGRGQDIVRFLQSPEYRSFRGMDAPVNQAPIPSIRPQLTGPTSPLMPQSGGNMGFLNNIRDRNIQRRRDLQSRRGRLGPSILFGNPNRVMPANERPMNPFSLSEIIEYLFEGNR